MVIQKVKENPNSNTHGHRDDSVNSFSGHQVSYTLIRCHFSPNKKYIYSGSSQGCVFIYDLEKNETAGILGSSSRAVNSDSNGVIRDMRWHPERVEIISSNLNSLVLKWEITKGGYQVETVEQSQVVKDRLQMQQEEVDSMQQEEEYQEEEEEEYEEYEEDEIDELDDDDLYE